METEENFEGSPTSNEALVSEAKFAEGDEDQTVQRIAQAMHRLGRAYQRERSYLESLKWLRSCWELYDYLHLREELVVCECDLAIAYLAEGLCCDFEPSEWAKSSKDERMDYVLSVIGANSVDISAVIKKARDMDTSKVAELALVDALLETGHMLRLWLCDYPRSLSLYEQALSMAPERLPVYLFIGMTHRALGNTAEAVKHYKQALALDPLYAEAWVNLGNVYFEDRKDLPHAEQCYVQALKALERGYDTLVSPGKVYCLLSEVFCAQGFVYNALETSMKGIGVDSMCTDNFSSAKSYAEKLGYTQLCLFLKQVCEVLDGKEEAVVLTVTDIESRYRSILLGALGELIQVCHRVITKYQFSAIEAETLKHSLMKVTDKQKQCLQTLYDIIGS